MIVGLDAIELNRYLLLEGIETGEDIMVNQVDVEDGSSVLQVSSYSGSRDLSLGTIRDGSYLRGGYILYHQLMSIKALAAAGQPVTLIHPRGTFTVLIVSTANMKLVSIRNNPQPNDWCEGFIQLKEVSQNA